MLRASVVIPTFNKSRFLDLTLTSLRLQTESEIELIVIDDGSTDDTAAVVAGHRSAIELVYYRQENQGRASARNQGLKRASGDVIIFCDDDRIVPPSFVRSHLACHEQASSTRIVLGWVYGIFSFAYPGLLQLPGLLLGHAAPRLLAALEQGAEITPLFTPEDLRYRFDDTIASFRTTDVAWESKARQAVELFGNSLSEFRLPWFVGDTGNMSVLRDRAISVGGFDEAFRGWGMEDTDFSYRLHQDGACFRIVEDAFCFQQVHPGSAGKLPDLLANVVRFTQKHDTIESYLLTRWGTGKLNLAQVNQLMMRIEEERARGDLTFERELVSTYRDLVCASFHAHAVVLQLGTIHVE